MEMDIPECITSEFRELHEQKEYTYVCHGSAEKSTVWFTYLISSPARPCRSTKYVDLS